VGELYFYWYVVGFVVRVDLEYYEYCFFVGFDQFIEFYLDVFERF